MMRLMEWLVGSSDAVDRVEELEEQLGQVEAQNVTLRAENQQLRTTSELQRTLIRALRDANADLDGRLS